MGMTQQQYRELIARIERESREVGLTPQQYMKLIASGQAGQILGGGAIVDPTIEGDPQTHLTDDGYRADIVDVRHEPLSDFDVQVAKREMAMRQAHGDDFARDAILLHKERGDFADRAVHTNPVSAAGSILGQSATVTTDQDPTTVAYWVGDDTEATNVTVTLGPGSATPQSGDIAFDIDPFARLTWGTRANQVTADIDIGRGCQFTIAASSVILRLGVNAVPAGVGVTTMLLSGMISFRQATHLTPITRTLPNAGINNGSNEIFVIPNFAKSFVVWRGDPNQSITITVEGYAGQTLFTVLRAASATGEPEFDPLVLPNNAAFVKVANTGGAPTTVRPIFNLSL